MSVPGIEAVQGLGFTPYVPPTVAPTAPAGPQATQQSGEAFGDLVLDGLDRLEAVQDKSDQLAVQAATGDLQDIHDYTLAAVAVRNRALEAFNEIMRMPIG
jgi:flagellar hook-basal body complex protein FliE